MSHTEIHQPLKQAFTVVADINQLAGNPANKGWEAVDHQMKIITGEWVELNEAVAARDPTALRDGAADLLFTLVGLAHRGGFDLLEDLLEVNRSNYSKFDTSYDDAVLTRIKYDELGLRTRMFIQMDGQSQVYVTRVDGDQAIGEKQYPDGKWLKSYRFEDVDFVPLPENHPLINPMAPVASGYLAEEIIASDKLSAYTETQDHTTIAAELPNKLAVRFIVECIATNPTFSRAVELWLAQMAYYHIWPNYKPNHTSGTTCSAMAVKGAQNFLDTLLLPDYKFRASLTSRYFSDWDTTHELGIESLFASLSDTADRVLLQRALEIIRVGMVADVDWQISWHANLTIAWFDAGLPHKESDELVNAIMKQLFNVDTTTIYDTTTNPSTPLSIEIG